MGIIRSAFGHYPAIDTMPTDDFLKVGHSFGTSINEGSPNHAIAQAILNYGGDQPIVVDRTLANAFPNGDLDVDEVVEGPISSQFGKGLGTWGILLVAQRFMVREGIESALMFGQANHIGRVLMQARHKDLGIIAYAPASLPGQFDTKSQEQPFVRSLVRWVPREVIGSFALRFQGRL